MVEVELVSDALRDKAGNVVRGPVSSFTVAAGASISLETSATQVNQGAVVTASLQNGPGLSSDWIGVFPVGGRDDQPIDWFYLNGTKSPSASGRNNAQLPFTAPATAGDFEFRFFSGGSRLAVSQSFEVSGVDIFLDFDGGYLPDLSGVVAVEGAAGQQYDAFHPYGTQTWDEQVRLILERVQADFAPFARLSYSR